MRQEAHFIQLLKGNKKVKQQLLIGNKMEPLILLNEQKVICSFKKSGTIVRSQSDLLHVKIRNKKVTSNMEHKVDDLLSPPLVLTVQEVLTQFI